MKDRDKKSEVLPDITAIEGVTLESSLDVFSAEELADIRANLDTMARGRREAEAESASLRLS